MGKVIRLNTHYEKSLFVEKILNEEMDKRMINWEGNEKKGEFLVFIPDNPLSEYQAVHDIAMRLMSEMIPFSIL